MPCSRPRPVRRSSWRERCSAFGRSQYGQLGDTRFAGEAANREATIFLAKTSVKCDYRKYVRLSNMRTP